MILKKIHKKSANEAEIDVNGRKNVSFGGIFCGAFEKDVL